MTVIDLRRKLAEFDDDLKVVIFDREYSLYEAVDGVRGDTLALHPRLDSAFVEVSHFDTITTSEKNKNIFANVNLREFEAVDCVVIGSGE